MAEPREPHSEMACERREPSALAGAESRIQALRLEMRLLASSMERERTDCCVCMARPADHALVPCGHAHCGCCADGFLRRRRCPLCRGAPDSLLRVFR